MQVVCCIASGGIVRGVFLPFPTSTHHQKTDLPPTLLGPLTSGGRCKDATTRSLLCDFDRRKYYLEKWKSTCTRHLFLWPHFIIRQLEMPLSTWKTDQIPTLFFCFFETIKSPDSDYYLALGTQDTRAYIAHRNNEFYYPFHFQKTKNEKKKSQYWTNYSSRWRNDFYGPLCPAATVSNNILDIFCLWPPMELFLNILMNSKRLITNYSLRYFLSCSTTDLFLFLYPFELATGHKVQAMLS